MNGDVKSRAQALIEKAGKADQAAEAEKRKRQIHQWINALKTADAAAKAKPGNQSRLYQVSYRIKGVTGERTGTSDHRREALTTILDSLSPRETHLSTSTWIVRLYIPEATAVLKLLKAPLAQWDFLAVAEVGDNRSKFGDADLG